MKADDAFGWTPGPSIEAMVEQGEMTLEEARRIFQLEMAHGSYAVHVITHSDGLPVAERGQFHNWLRLRYGRPGVSRFIYETGLKPIADPETVQAVESVLSDGRTLAWALPAPRG